MAKNVLLSVDLNNITADQRKVFNASLAEQHYAKHNRLTTIWTVVFKEGATDESAIKYTRDVVSAAATKAKILAYDVLIHVGDAKPTEYSLSPK